jgi:hypothetical protein
MNETETPNKSEIEQAKRDFNNFLESRRSEIDFLVEYGEPFYDGTENGGL